MKEVRSFQCENCERVYAAHNVGVERAKEIAEKCCICPECGKPKGHRYGNSECEKCRPIIWARRDAARMAKLKTVPYEISMVLNDDGDRFFFDDDDLCCYLEDLDIEDRPEFLLVCEANELSMCAYGIVESALDEHYEDAGDCINKEQYAELQSHLDTFCKDVGIKTWSPDNKRKVSVQDIVKTLEVNNNQNLTHNT